MKRRILSIGFVLLSFVTSVWAQPTTDITINLLVNEDIVGANVDIVSISESLKSGIDLMEEAFKGSSKKQKAALLYIYHKEGKPTLNLYTNPKVDKELEQKLLEAVQNVKVLNTKFIDLPVILSMNNENGYAPAEFTQLEDAFTKDAKAYESASLKEKYELNKRWAATEVLPILGAIEAKVDDTFLGVKNLGALISKTNFTDKQDIEALTSRNSDYWRGIMEMAPGNQLVFATKIFGYVSQGEFDIAQKYLEMAIGFSKEGNGADVFLSELALRLNLFNEELGKEIEVGIAEHDKGHYKEALAIYNNCLTINPNSAWIHYEIYYSQNASDVITGKRKLDNHELWDESKVNIYKHNPLYSVAPKASNADEAYNMYRRKEINTLFKDKNKAMDDLYTYANICMDIEAYDNAAQIYWLVLTYNKDNEAALARYLYCLEKFDVKDLKGVFKGNFKKEFKRIEADMKSEKEKNSFYKAFKN